ASLSLLRQTRDFESTREALLTLLRPAVRCSGLPELRGWEREVLLLLAFWPNELEEVAGIGPVYRRVFLGAGRARRTLDVPCPILHRAQAILLRRTLGPALASLFPAAGRGVYSNARPHIGARYVVNLDLRRFFPSIRAGQVIAALLR